MIFFQITFLITSLFLMSLFNLRLTKKAICQGALSLHTIRAITKSLHDKSEDFLKSIKTCDLSSVFAREGNLYSLHSKRLSLEMELALVSLEEIK